MSSDNDVDIAEGSLLSHLVKSRGQTGQVRFISYKLNTLIIFEYCHLVLKFKLTVQKHITYNKFHFLWHAPNEHRDCNICTGTVPISWKFTAHNPKTFTVVVGKVQKRENEGGWRKKSAACPQGPGLKPRTYHFLAEGPQLNATEVVQKYAFSVPIERVRW